jgi:hypothetical protein
MTKSQNQRLIEIIEQEGKVSRNYCLRLFPAITRLSARIQHLEKLGYRFDPSTEHGDYVYKLVCVPAPKQSELFVL